MELLVAIIIIMILAGYAIFAYLDSMREGENTRAKAKLELIHAGYERFLMEYPNDNLSGASFANTHNTGDCLRTDTTPGRLIGCGYVPKMNFDAMDYIFSLGNNCDCGVYSNSKPICDGNAYMTPRPGVSMGRFSASTDYCAGINMMKGGRAVDGTI